MMAYIKTGVKLDGLQPQMVLAFYIVCGVFNYLWTGHSPTVTSCNDGKHMDGSLHYLGRALDFRTHDFLGDKQNLVKMCKEALGAEFDVVIEDLGGPNEHLHVEYDPK